MNRSNKSKSNPRTPISINKYQKNLQSSHQNSSGKYKGNISSNDTKISHRGQEIQYQDCNPIHNTSENKDIYYPQKQIIKVTGIPSDINRRQEESLKMKQEQISFNEVNYNIQNALPENTKQILNRDPQNSSQKNITQIQSLNEKKQSFIRSSKESQENLLTTKKLQSIVSPKNNGVGQQVNLQNFTSEQLQKEQLHLQSSQNSNIFFKELIGQPKQQYIRPDTENSDRQNTDNLNYLKDYNQSDNFQKNHHLPIQIDITNQVTNHKLMKQDSQQLLMNKQYSSNNLLITQKNNKENNISRTPLRKGSCNNISKVSLNTTPQNLNSAHNENQKKFSKCNSKSTLKIIQDSSNFNSFILQQKQQQTNTQQESQNKFVQFHTQYAVQQPKQNQLSFYDNQPTNQSQQVNNLNSISIQSQNSNILHNTSQQNKFNSSKTQETQEKQFYQNIENINSKLQEQEKIQIKNNQSPQNQLKYLQIGLPLQNITRFTTTCNSTQSTNRMVEPNNAQNKTKIHIEQNIFLQNHNDTKNVQINHESSPSKNYNSIQKSMITQDEDYSVPQELKRHSFQVDKYMNNLQNIATVKALDNELLKSPEKMNILQQQNFRSNSEIPPNTFLSNDNQRIKQKINENQISMINSQQINLKSHSSNKLNISPLDYSNQLSNRNYNEKEVKSALITPLKQQKPINILQYSGNNGAIINNLTPINGSIYPTIRNNDIDIKRQYINPSNQKTITKIDENSITQNNGICNTSIIQNNLNQINGNATVSINENDTQRQFNRLSVDSFIDATTKNIPQPFISQEKQTKLTMQHKNKTNRRNCNCDGDLSLMDSCSKVLGWLGKQKDTFSINQTLLLSIDHSQLDNKILCQIQKDVTRTYQNYEFFWNPQIQSTIQHILYKFTKVYPEIGYVQGLNLIVGQLIWHADELNSFELLLRISSILNLNDLLKPGFPDLQKHLKIIEVLMMLNCPKIYQILNKYDLHPTMFISEWILILLTDIIPLEHSFQLLDGIINLGWIFIYRAIINLIKQLLKTLENLDDQSEILYALKSVRTKQKEYSINWQYILSIQEPFISNEFIDQIQNHIRQNSLQM